MFESIHFFMIASPLLATTSSFLKVANSNYAVKTSAPGTVTNTNISDKMTRLAEPQQDSQQNRTRTQCNGTRTRKPLKFRVRVPPSAEYEYEYEQEY